MVKKLASLYILFSLAALSIFILITMGADTSYATGTEALTRTVSGGMAQTAPDAPIQTASDAISQTAPDAPIQTASGAMAQIASDAPIQTASGAKARTASDAPIQTATSALTQTATSGIAQTASSAPIQTASSALIQTASSVPARTVSDVKPIEYFEPETIAENYELITREYGHYSTDYWHHSGGYWMDGPKKESAIYDWEHSFWVRPELYYDRPGMQINIAVALPGDVKKRFSEGGEVLISVRPLKPEAINEKYTATYFYDDESLHIHAMPVFLIDEHTSYTEYLPDLRESIPVVRDGYGHNTYSIFKSGVHIGSAQATISPDPEKIEMTDILDVRGRLKPGKEIKIFREDLTNTYEKSEDIIIGDGSFDLAGAVGMMFSYVFEVSFYERLPDKAPETKEEDTPDPPAPPIPPEPPQPNDLAVAGHRLELSKTGGQDYFTRGSNISAGGAVRVSSAVISYIKVINNSKENIPDAVISFSYGRSATDTLDKTVALRAGEEREIAFEWMTPESPGAMTVTAHINPDQSIEEADYSNNKREFEVLVVEEMTDLLISDVLPSQYPAGKQVITLVEVRNNSAGSLSGDREVEVKLTVPATGFTKTVKISMDAGADQQVPFLWTAPPATPSFEIIAEVNASRTIPETDYSNNSKTIIAVSSSQANPSYGCNTTRRTWTESRLSHYRTVSYTILGVVHTRRIPVYVDVEFYAEVSISARLVPGTMKSGYGVECEVTTTVRTNYDLPGYVTELQSVYAYSPASGYSEAVALERSPGAGAKWRFPVNPSSVAGSRVLYVPVEWPDGSYFEIRFTGRDAMSPGGAMCASTEAVVFIDGNMYLDDSTNPMKMN
ncbi:MAG: hypothetical protein FWH55_04655 [Oscillospiraceae bacterium]|nr:hypothetical protein [Oscillospiraceae bacterium]